MAWPLALLVCVIPERTKATYNLIVDKPVPELGHCGALAEVGRVESFKDMGGNLLGEVGHGVLVRKCCAWRRRKE